MTGATMREALKDRFTYELLVRLICESKAELHVYALSRDPILKTEIDCKLNRALEVLNEIAGAGAVSPGVAALKPAPAPPILEVH